MVWLRYELWENHDDLSYRLADKAETDRLKAASPASHLRNIFYAPSPAAAEAQYCALRGIGPYIVNPADSEEPFTMAQLKSQLADFPDDDRLARQPALPQASGPAVAAPNSQAPAETHGEHHEHTAPHAHDDRDHGPVETIHTDAHHAPDHSHDHHEATLAHSVEHHDNADTHVHDDHGHAPVATVHADAHPAPDHSHDHPEPASPHPVEHHAHADPHAHDDHGHAPAATLHADAHQATDQSHDHHATPAPVASTAPHHEAEPATHAVAPIAPAPKVTSARIDALGPITLATDAPIPKIQRRKPNAFFGFLRLVVRLVMLAIVLGAVTVGVGVATGNLDAQTLLAQARELPTQIREHSTTRSLLP